MCYLKMFVFWLMLFYVLFKETVVEAKVTDEEYFDMPELFHLDDFDKCMTLKNRALYCSLVVELLPIDLNNTSSTWNIIYEVNQDPRNYRHNFLRHGICVSKSCPKIEAIEDSSKKTLQDKISKCYSLKYEDKGLKAAVTEMQCETDQNLYPVDEYDIAVAIALGILVWIVLFATFYEGLARYNSKEEYERTLNTLFGRIMACFSLRKNWTRLQSDITDPDAFPLRGIQGIRFYNTQLVILAHAAMMAMAGPLQNPTYTENITRKAENIIFVNSYCIIQTFMLITGFLITYNFMLLIQKKKNFQLHYIILAFVNRYIRLTPCLIVMIALNATWFYRIARGPVWNQFVGVEYRNCRKNWWANLLYINNYYDAENMCMQHTWYLATDTQLFMVCLLVVSLIWIYQERAKLILITSMVIGITLPGLIHYYYNYDIVIRPLPETFSTLFLKDPQWHTMYSSALTNYGAYALGLLFGYLAFNARTKKFLTNKIYITIWWTLIWGLPLSVICYGFLIYQDDFTYNRLGAAVYASLQKNLFALGLSMFVYGLTENVGWFMRDCVTWSPLQVFGRLTYCTYLVHVVVIRIRGGQERFPTFMSNHTLISLIMQDTVVSYIFALVLVMFVEMPVSALQKLMVPQLAKKETTGLSASKSKKTLKDNINKRPVKKTKE